MRYKKLIVVILTLFSLIGIWCWLIAYQSKNDEEIAQMLGIPNAEINSFDYSDSWNLRDYDIVEKYKLSNSTIYSFLTNSSFILCDKEYETDSLLWRKVNWHKTPIDSIEYNEVYEMVFNTIREDSRRNEWLLEACEILRSRNGYFSFYEKKTGSAVAFHILDIRRKVLYAIYLKL